MGKSDTPLIDLKVVKVKGSMSIERNPKVVVNSNNKEANHLKKNLMDYHVKVFKKV